MSYVVRVLMTEEKVMDQKPGIGGNLYVDGQYQFKNLEIAREAAQVACNAAAKLKPRRSRTMNDDDWTEHPDRFSD